MIKFMTLIPGDLLLPSMVHTQAYGRKETPGVVFLKFDSVETSHGPGCRYQQHKSTIHIPIKAVDAAGLLRTLNKLQQQGLIPHVVEPNSPQQAN